MLFCVIFNQSFLTLDITTKLEDFHHEGNSRKVSHKFQLIIRKKRTNTEDCRTFSPHIRCEYKKLHDHSRHHQFLAWLQRCNLKLLAKLIENNFLRFLHRVSKLQSLLLCVAACVVSSYGYSLDCSSFYETDYGSPMGLQFGGYCQVNFGDNDFENLAAITGDLGGRPLSDVGLLYVYGYGPNGYESIEHLPSNLATLVPNLVSLTWSTKLKHVKASDFSSWPNLVQLNLYNNMIRQLPGNLLSSNTNLQWIDFSMNSIANIGSGFFTGLNSLTQINMYSNPCLSNYMSSSMDMTQTKKDIAFYCEALPAPVSNTCPAACSANIAAIEARVNAAAAKVDTINDFIALLP